MQATEYDVYLCCGKPEGDELAATLAAGLARRGFRVLEDVERRPGSDRAAMPDVVMLITAGIFSPDAEGERCRREAGRALAAGRNVVCVYAPGQNRASIPFPPDLAALARSYRVGFDPARPRESIALVAHGLSSDSAVDERRLMRRAKRLFLAAALILVAGVALQEIPLLIARWSRPRLLAPVPPFAVSFSAIGQRPRDGSWFEIPVAKDSVVRPGDQLRIDFAPSADGYAYVVARDARGEVTVLFPPDTMRDASRVRGGALYAAPAGGGWLTVDEQAGLDAIYLIAGYDPLQNLEELVEEAEPRTAAARLDLVESTVQGLLDGRHGDARRLVWTGKLHPIGRDLAPPRVALKSSTTLGSGQVVARGLTQQVGLVSASVEIRLRFERNPPG